LAGCLDFGLKRAYPGSMIFTIEYEQETDGRWLAEVKELPGALAYGRTSDEAGSKVQALALRVLADPEFQARRTC